MDFFERQEQARRRTRLLLLLFAAAVLAVLLVNYLVLATVIQPFLKPLPHSRMRMDPIYSIFWLFGEALMNPGDFLKWLWDPWLAVWIALGTFLSVGLGCYYKMRVLSEGGAAVARLLNGRIIDPGTNDADERRLRNVIEEMAIASGTPVPGVYVLDNERGINALAAGHTRQDVAIAVTRGCLKLLARDELQGVIAHEFSHVLNGDTRLNMQLMSLAHGLFWPTYLGRLLIYGSTEAPPDGDPVLDKDAASRYLPTAPVGVVFLVFGSISLPFVRLLKSAVCRQREWLADASAVQFTRNPGGIVGAFKKIGGLYKHGRLDTPQAEVASHLYFVNCAFDSWLSFLSVHPPLVKRIQALDPAFDGQFQKVAVLTPNQYEREQAYDRVVTGIIAAESLPSADWVASAGNLAAGQLHRAAVLRLGLPNDVKQQVTIPAGAASIVYGLLLNEEEAVRAKQLEILRAGLDAASFERTVALAGQIAQAGHAARIPLAELAVPPLRQLSAQDTSQFCQIMQQLIECDREIDLFEYMLMKMVQRRLAGFNGGAAMSRGRIIRVQEVLSECGVVLSALAHVGQDTEPEARRAFGEGLQFLDVPAHTQIEFIPRSRWDLCKVDAALEQLFHCSPSTRRNILVACGKTVVADGRVGEREAELLRTIADSLDCPIPPFVEAVRSEEAVRAV